MLALYHLYIWIIKNARESDIGEYLSRLSEDQKALIRMALTKLNKAYLAACLSTDLNEIDEQTSKASDAVDAAVNELPNGLFKGSLVACKKALGHSFMLRYIKTRNLDTTNPEVSKILEEIILRYQLGTYPEYERSSRILALAKVYIESLKDICFDLGIIDSK